MMLPPLVQNKTNMHTSRRGTRKEFISAAETRSHIYNLLCLKSEEVAGALRWRRRPHFQQDNWRQWSSHHSCPSEPKCVSAIQSSLACVHCMGDINLPGTLPLRTLVLDMWRPARKCKLLDLIKFDKCSFIGFYVEFSKSLLEEEIVPASGGKVYCLFSHNLRDHPGFIQKPWAQLLSIVTSTHSRHLFLLWIRFTILKKKQCI